MISNAIWLLREMYLRNLFLFASKHKQSLSLFLAVACLKRKWCRMCHLMPYCTPATVNHLEGLRSPPLRTPLVSSSRSHLQNLKKLLLLILLRYLKKILSFDNCKFVFLVLPILPQHCFGLVVELDFSRPDFLGIFWVGCQIHQIRYLGFGVCLESRVFG